MFKNFRNRKISNPHHRLSFLQVIHEGMLQSNHWYSFFESLRGFLNEIQNKAY